jgi:L-malate glycosyltransferase
MPAIRERHPGVQLAIGGTGPELDALRSAALAHGVGDAVHFLGRCEEPIETLRGSQICVHPSWAESFPYVILEAMAVGLPIVASDVGGIGEALVHGRDGVLVPARNRDALARALIDLLDDPLRARQMGDSARARVREQFTKSAMIAGLMGVYEEVLLPRRPTTRR